MAGEEQFEQLIEHLRSCLNKARELKVEHAVCLLNMTIMEVSETYVERSKPPPSHPDGRSARLPTRDTLQ